MGDVRRYVPWHGAEMEVAPSDQRDIRLRVQYVEHSDYARLERERDALKQQAEIHAMEARAANATIAEIYQAVTGSTGEPGNWNGAVPVVAELTRLRAVEAAANAWLDYEFSDEHSAELVEALAEACGRKG